ncbi:DNA helicase RecQ [Sphingomonas sp. ID0503]|uniref:DNA helicase RecQ n=1 Tax=Sphingomonas sp. ID0503 TaxID=3399691 RepID=UPI003AFB00D5
MHPDIAEILHRTFGYSSLRGSQPAVIDRIMAGRDTLAVMPTGAGKSLCYQLPALARQGTGLVISPLIALMHDQVRSAEAVGIRAAALTSADENRDETLRRFRSGELDLLYAAPERASGEGFRRLLTEVRLSLIAIDEAHCVSEWGHDFRPDYRLLRPLLDSFPDVPRLALTATADNATRRDILTQLGIPEDGLIVAGFDRPNIRYSISPRDGVPRQIADLVTATPGPGIVYAPTRDATERLALSIGQATGRPARAYHAGLDAPIRARNQAAFVASEDMVMVATVAFGMGIDKPDVRFVAHAGLPKSIESYYQETGRAGRDGEPSVAHLFWGAEDFSRARKRVEELEESRRAGERQRLNAMAGLVESAGCRRAILLRHFGETPPERCGNCDNCLAPPKTVDATEIARKFLSAAFRTEMRFGVTHLADVLAGKDNDKIRGFGHHKLSVFGIADEEEMRLVKPVARALLARDALRADDYGGLSFGPGAKPILKGEETVALVLPPKRERRRKDGTGKDYPDDPLFDALRARRREIANELGVPPYVIFHDATLREMAATRPYDLRGLAEISGVGTRKLKEYGQAFLDVLNGRD